jgi:hypothetical protein
LIWLQRASHAGEGRSSFAQWPVSRDESGASFTAAPPWPGRLRAPAAWSRGPHGAPGACRFGRAVDAPRAARSVSSVGLKRPRRAKTRQLERGPGSQAAVLQREDKSRGRENETRRNLNAHRGARLRRLTWSTRLYDSSQAYRRLRSSSSGGTLTFTRAPQGLRLPAHRTTAVSPGATCGRNSDGTACLVRGSGLPSAKRHGGSGGVRSRERGGFPCSSASRPCGWFMYVRLLLSP